MYTSSNSTNNKENIINQYFLNEMDKNLVLSFIEKKYLDPKIVPQD